jgi:hypothetical protein
VAGSAGSEIEVMNLMPTALARRAALVAAAGVLVASLVSAAAPVRTSQFAGAKANTGMASAMMENGQLMLTLSDDFKVPDTPAPHWQVVDSSGNTYLLQRLVIKGDKYNQTITVPSHVKDVVKVQIWCAWAEALLGEASFPSTVRVK